MQNVRPAMMSDMCMCVRPIYSGAAFTDVSVDVSHGSAGVTPEVTQELFSFLFCVIAPPLPMRCLPYVVFFARRIQPSLPLVDCETECGSHDLDRFHLQFAGNISHSSAGKCSRESRRTDCSVMQFIGW